MEADAAFCNQCGVRLPAATAPSAAAPQYPPPPQGWQPPLLPPPGYPPHVPPGNTGFPGVPMPQQYYLPRAQYDGLSVAALVLGIASIMVYPLGVVLGTLAVVFSRKGRENILRDPGYSGMGFTTAGLVTGIIGISISALFWVIMLIAAVAH